MPIRDDSAGGYGQWSSDDLSWLDYVKAKGSDVGGAAYNALSNVTGALSPVGTSPQGNMALQVPPMLTGLADSYSRLAGTPSNPGNAYDLSGVDEFDAPIQQDMSNVLLSLYGGNALNPLARRPAGSVGAGGLKGQEKYFYHGTRPENLDSIRRYGLKPNEYGNPLNFHEYMDSANDYRFPLKNEQFDMGSAPGPLFRVAKSNLPTSTIFDGPHIRTNDSVPPTVLEMLDGDDWVKLLFSDTGKPSIFGSAAATAGEAQPIKAYHSTDMSSEARMTRAKDMGFPDEPWYHGTSGNFPEFKPSKDGYIGPGVYLSSDKGVAAEYGPVVGEYRVRGQLADEGMLSDVMSDLIRSGSRDAHVEALAELKKRGYSGIRHGQNVAVWKPENIRSIDAAFDPSRIDENGLLLSDTGKPSIAGAALATAGEDYYLPPWLKF